MLHLVTLIVTIEEVVMISSFRRSWALTVGTNMLIWLSLVYLLFKLTMQQHNIWYMNIILMYSSMIFLKKLLIKICIRDQPYFHQQELVEAHCMSLLGHIWQHISSKHAINEDYIMVEVIPTMINSYAESLKWIQHGCALFVIWSIRMIITGT